ncbi:MAG: hypothetical protein WC670_12550, partial [Pseudolabrys sp.]
MTRRSKHFVIPGSLAARAPRNDAISRRAVLGLAAAALAATQIPRRASAQPIALDTDRHGMSAFGDLQYPPDFKQFAFVNPDAPKGGTYS